MKILIVEDEPELLEVMAESLSRDGFTIDRATDYSTALDKVISFEYDCILLDIMVPGGNGLQLLSEIKKKESSDAVIIISAKNSVEDRVLGLRQGADDYLSKPFHLAELSARVASAVRRRNHHGRMELRWGNICMFPEHRESMVGDRPLQLTKKEFDILYYFIINGGRTINRIALTEYVWGSISESANNLDFLYSQIKNLRKKLSDIGAGVDIQVVYGVGYRISDHGQEIS